MFIKILTSILGFSTSKNREGYLFIIKFKEISVHPRRSCLIF